MADAAGVAIVTGTVAVLVLVAPGPSFWREVSRCGVRKA